MSIGSPIQGEVKKKQWEDRLVKPSLKKFGIDESPARCYTPADIEGFDEVKKCLGRLGEASTDESINPMPLILEAVKAYATIGEMSDALRGVFGVFQPYNI